MQDRGQCALPTQMVCPNCSVLTGRQITHPNDECPQAASFLCRRCHCRGHLTRNCTEMWPQWERPTTYEELIPPDIKMRYGIRTHTLLTFEEKRGAPGTEQELHDSNEIVIPEDYIQLNEFAIKNKIKVEKVTKPSLDKCIEAIKSWGISHGFRIVIR